MSTDTSTNKYRNWVFTWNADSNDELPEVSKLDTFLKDDFELYVFQKEKGEETCRDHIQGCFRTKIRMRQGTLLKKFDAYFPETDTKYLTINRMCGEWAENFVYCTKQETRVGDEYYCSMELRKYTGLDVKFLKEREARFPWQKELFKIIFNEDESSLKTPDDRKIVWVTDSKGNSGKSKLVKFLCFTYPDICKVSFGTAAQLRSGMIAAGQHKAYMIDIPRTLGEDDSLESLISVLEDIKNGFVVSNFYGQHNVLMMPPPHIICFSNMRAPRALMSEDRWEEYVIDTVTKEWIDGKYVEVAPRPEKV